MIKRKITIEHLLFLLAFMIALGIRMLALGRQPLSDYEAIWALQSLDVTEGIHSLLGPQPFYILFTSLIFYMFDSSNFLARLLPAVAGSFLVLSPLFFRRSIGRTAAIILSFGFALDPGLVAISRMADGRMAGIAFLLLTIGLILSGRLSWAGFCFGLSLLAGPSIWAGWLGLALAIGWTWFRSRKTTARDASWVGNLLSTNDVESLIWKPFFYWCAGTLLFAGTLFFIVPAGLSALFSSIVDYFQSWSQLPTVGLTEFFVSLLAYEFIALIFGLWGVIRNFGKQNNGLDRFLSLWLLVTFLLALTNPSRQSVDLLWPIIPLWLLAARQAWRVFNPAGFMVPAENLHNHTDQNDAQTNMPSLKGRSAYMGQAALVVALFGFIVINLRVLSQVIPGDTTIPMRWAGVGGAILLIVMISLLVGWGWSSRVAGDGLLLGLTILLLTFSISSMWNSAGLGPNPSAEMWSTVPSVLEADLLERSIGDISEWNTPGGRNYLDLTVENVQSPALEWVIREYPNLAHVSYVSSDSTPSMLISRDHGISLKETYSGQDFIWQAKPIWDPLDLHGWADWLFFRNIKTVNTDLILWVRSDYFPGTESSSGELRNIDVTN
jgi:hypothetical protein